MPGGSVNRNTPQLSGVSQVCIYLLCHGNNVLSPAGCTYNSNAFRHHHLITAMRVQIPGAHEASLRRVSMYPAEDHQVLSVDIIE